MKILGYIIVVKRSGNDGTPYPLTSANPSCSIGRGIECDIRVQLPVVSCQHCRIEVEASGKAYLTNISSSNPAYLNDVRLCPEEVRLLNHTDVIHIADRKLRWEYPEESALCLTRKENVTFKILTPKSKAPVSYQQKVPSNDISNRVDAGEQIQDAARRKKVSFGRELDPEHFDILLPPSTPIRKGEKPDSFAFASPYTNNSVKRATRLSAVPSTPSIAEEVGAETPTKSLLRRRSPTPIKPYLARSLGLLTPKSLSKNSNTSEQIASKVETNGDSGSHELENSPSSSPNNGASKSSPKSPVQSPKTMKKPHALSSQASPETTNVKQKLRTPSPKISSKPSSPKVVSETPGSKSVSTSLEHSCVTPSRKLPQIPISKSASKTGDKLIPDTKQDQESFDSSLLVVKDGASPTLKHRKTESDIIEDKLGSSQKSRQSLSVDVSVSEEDSQAKAHELPLTENHAIDISKGPKLTPSPRKGRCNELKKLTGVCWSSPRKLHLGKRESPMRKISKSGPLKRQSLRTPRNPKLKASGMTKKNTPVILFDDKTELYKVHDTSRISKINTPSNLKTKTLVLDLDGRTHSEDTLQTSEANKNETTKVTPLKGGPSKRSEEEILKTPKVGEVEMSGDVTNLTQEEDMPEAPEIDKTKSLGVDMSEVLETGKVVTDVEVLKTPKATTSAIVTPLTPTENMPEADKTKLPDCEISKALEPENPETDIDRSRKQDVGVPKSPRAKSPKINTPKTTGKTPKTGKNTTNLRTPNGDMSKRSEEILKTPKVGEVELSGDDTNLTLDGDISEAPDIDETKLLGAEQVLAVIDTPKEQAVGALRTPKSKSPKINSPQTTGKTPKTIKNTTTNLRTPKGEMSKRSEELPKTPKVGEVEISGGDTNLTLDEDMPEAPEIDNTKLLGVEKPKTVIETYKIQEVAVPRTPRSNSPKINTPKTTGKTPKMSKSMTINMRTPKGDMSKSSEEEIPQTPKLGEVEISGGDTNLTLEEDMPEAPESDKTKSLGAEEAKAGVDTPKEDVGVPRTVRSKSPKIKTPKTSEDTTTNPGTPKGDISKKSEIPKTPKISEVEISGDDTNLTVEDMPEAPEIDKNKLLGVEEAITDIGTPKEHDVGVSRTPKSNSPKINTPKIMEVVCSKTPEVRITRLDTPSSLSDGSSKEGKNHKSSTPKIPKVQMLRDDCTLVGKVALTEVSETVETEAMLSTCDVEKKDLGSLDMGSGLDYNHSPSTNKSHAAKSPSKRKSSGASRKSIRVMDLGKRKTPMRKILKPVSVKKAKQRCKLPIVASTVEHIKKRKASLSPASPQRKKMKIGTKTPSAGNTAGPTKMPKTTEKAKKSWANILKEGLMAHGIPAAKAHKASIVMDKARQLRRTRKQKVIEDFIPTFNQEIPKNFNFTQSTGHVDSPAPIIIRKKIAKTPKVPMYRKGQKTNVEKGTKESISDIDLEGLTDLLNTPKSKDKDIIKEVTGWTLPDIVNHFTPLSKAVRVKEMFVKNRGKTPLNKVPNQETKTPGTPSSLNSFSTVTSPGKDSMFSPVTPPNANISRRTRSLSSVTNTPVSHADTTNFDFCAVKTPDITSDNLISPLVTPDVDVKSSEHLLSSQESVLESPVPIETDVTTFDFENAVTPVVTPDVFVSPMSTRSRLTTPRVGKSQKVSQSVGSAKRNIALSEIDETLADVSNARETSFCDVDILHTPKTNNSNVLNIKRLLIMPKESSASNSTEEPVQISQVQGENHAIGSPDVTDMKLEGLKTPAGEQGQDDTNMKMKRLLRTPKECVPENDPNYTDDDSIKNPPVTPTAEQQPSSKDFSGQKRQLRSSKQVESPGTDYSNVAGIRKLMKTPKADVHEHEPDYTDVAGVKKLMETPKPDVSIHKPDYTDVDGVENLLRTPVAEKEPDYTDVAHMKRLTKISRLEVESPGTDYSDVAGIKKLMKTPRGDVPEADVAGIRELLRTPQAPVIEEPDYRDVAGLKRLLRTPIASVESPGNDYSDVVGVKKLMKTPKVVSNPEPDYANVAGLKKLLSTPNSAPESPTADYTNVHGIKKLLRTPKSAVDVTPEGDYSDVTGVKKLMKTPTTRLSEQKGDYSNVVGLKKLLKTPKTDNSPVADYTNVLGIKKLVSTPGEEVPEREADYSHITGIRKILKTPKAGPASPQADYSQVTGLKKLLLTPKDVVPEHEADYTDVSGLKKLLRSPVTSEKESRPECDYTNVHGLKKLLKTPQRSKNMEPDYSSPKGLKKLMATPRKVDSEPLSDYTNVTGLKNLLKTPTATMKSPQADYTQVYGVRNLLKTPKAIHKSSDADLEGLSYLLKTPLSDNSNVEQLLDLVQESVSPAKSSSRAPTVTCLETESVCENIPPKDDLKTVVDLVRDENVKEVVSPRRSHRNNKKQSNADDALIKNLRGTNRKRTREQTKDGSGYTEKDAEEVHPTKNKRSRTTMSKSSAGDSENKFVLEKSENKENEFGTTEDEKEVIEDTNKKTRSRRNQQTHTPAHEPSSTDSEIHTSSSEKDKKSATKTSARRVHFETPTSELVTEEKSSSAVRRGRPKKALEKSDSSATDMSEILDGKTENNKRTERPTRRTKGQSEKTKAEEGQSEHSKEEKYEKIATEKSDNSMNDMSEIVDGKTENSKKSERSTRRVRGLSEKIKAEEGHSQDSKENKSGKVTVEKYDSSVEDISGILDGKTEDNKKAERPSRRKRGQSEKTQAEEDLPQDSKENKSGKVTVKKSNNSTEDMSEILDEKTEDKKTGRPTRRTRGQPEKTKAEDLSQESKENKSGKVTVGKSNSSTEDTSEILEEKTEENKKTGRPTRRTRGQSEKTKAEEVNEDAHEKTTGVKQEGNTASKGSNHEKEISDKITKKSGRQPRVKKTLNDNDIDGKEEETQSTTKHGNKQVTLENEVRSTRRGNKNMPSEEEIPTTPRRGRRKKLSEEEEAVTPSKREEVQLTKRGNKQVAVENEVQSTKCIKNTASEEENQPTPRRGRRKKPSEEDKAPPSKSEEDIQPTTNCGNKKVALESEVQSTKRGNKKMASEDKKIVSEEEIQPTTKRGRRKRPSEEEIASPPKRVSRRTRAQK
ncbi:proliferation marker protein Ki-67-like [Macrobrachium rosenbergii]|uniref:proliferation marker protein Ki-67-like n=1 Tax=Macrobrachium rosenbergii TaxID=79674 RepID=UPI0034D546BD